MSRRYRLQPNAGPCPANGCGRVEAVSEGGMKRRPSCALCITCRLCLEDANATCKLCEHCRRCHPDLSGKG